MTKVLAVIHLSNVETLMRNAKLALEEGCDGLFLINHGSDTNPIDGVERVKEVHPKAWVGVNLLRTRTVHAFQLLNPSVDGLWADNACINEESDNQDAAHLISVARKHSKWKGLYFGGVAFKCSKRVEFENLQRAARIASDYMDVVTTSGPGTGRAADPERVAELRKGLPEGGKLAIASGITPENAGLYLAYTDFYLVATGISLDWHNIDPTKLKALIKVVKG